MSYNCFSLDNDFVNCTVAIESDLYKKKSEVFDLLFMNFKKDLRLPNSNCYYVKEYNPTNNCMKNNYIYINLSERKWLYYLFIDIENIIIKHLSPQVTCIHGSGVCLDGEAIIFVGDRNIGKSTIIKKLLKESALYSYLDDDVIMLRDGLVWGPGLPIKSRAKDSSCVMECDDEIRYLTNYLKINNEPQNISSIVYPTYNKIGSNIVEELSPKQSFQYLFKNIKHGEVSLSIKTAVEISMQCRSFRLDYSNDEFLFSSVKNIFISNIK